VVVVRHLNKRPDSNALYRGGGSIGIIGAARTGLLVGVDPDDEQRQVLAVSKSNLAAKPSSLAYRLVNDSLYGVAKVVWEGDVEHTATDLLGHPTERPSPQQDKAEDFLRQALADAERPVAWLQKVAKSKRISWRTVQRAKEALEVIVERRGEEGRRGGGAWWWRLPGGQLSIKDAALYTSGDGNLNLDHETTGQSHDSGGSLINNAMPSDGGEVEP
jgi:hypothetical protein